MWWVWTGSSAFFLCLHKTITCPLGFILCAWRKVPWKNDSISLSRKYTDLFYCVTTFHLTFSFTLQCFKYLLWLWSEWHEVDYTKPSPCSSPLFPLHASRWACFQLQTNRQERWSTHSSTGLENNFIGRPQDFSHNPPWTIHDAGWACHNILLTGKSETQCYSLVIILSDIPVGRQYFSEAAAESWDLA